MKYLIVDDEPITHQIIEDYCRELDFLSCAGNCYDGLQALNHLDREPVDLIFLDIQMPKLQGFDFLQTLKRPPQIVIISAHREYALESYDFDVCDYLLKPFSFERFLRAVQKARARGDEAAPTASTERERHETMFIKDDKKYHQVKFDDICYVEACRNYCIVHLTGRRIITLEKISAMEANLPAKSFLRIHRSYIVAVNRISEIANDRVHIGEEEIPIGRTYKAKVHAFLSGTHPETK